MRASHLGLAFTFLSFTAPARAGVEEPSALAPPGAASLVAGAEPSAPPPPTGAAPGGVTAGARPLPDFRFGVDGSIVSGAFVYSTLSLRIEAEVKPQGNMMLRLGYLRGGGNQEENEVSNAGLAFLGYNFYVGEGFDGGLALLGYRSYSASGNAYAGFAGGVVAAHNRGAEWTVLPDLSAGAGVKLGPLDLGIGFSIPQLAIGITLGIELSTASLPAGSTAPSKPGVPRRRVQYRSSR